MYLKDEDLVFLFFQDGGNMVFNFVNQQYAGGYLAGSATGRTFFGCVDIHFWPDALPGYLHKAEFA